jgi:hypothetical protein
VSDRGTHAFPVIRVALLVVLAGVLVAATLEAAPWSTDKRGSFNVDCAYHHSLPDDPIVAPRIQGASHLHDFFGNVGTDAASTLRTLPEDTTCELSADRSGYWNPALTLGGRRVLPIRVAAYYFGVAKRQVESIPQGLQMIAGSADAVSPAANPHVAWSCSDETPWSDHPYRCDGGGRVQARVDFPSCWTGRGLHPVDVTYPEHGCPDEFPHRIARLTYRVRYPMTDPCLGATPCSVDEAPEENIAVSLASGPYYSMHADYWSVWDGSALPDLVSTCLNAHIECGGQSDLVTDAASTPA